MGKEIVYNKKMAKDDKPQKKKTEDAEDSEQEENEKLEYIDRKEDKANKDEAGQEGKPKENADKKKQDSSKENTEKNAEEAASSTQPEEEETKPKEKSLAQEIQEAMVEKNEPMDSDGQLFYEHDLHEKSYSVWNLDTWIKDYFCEWNSIVPYTIEILIVACILFVPSSFWIYKNWDTFNLESYFQTPGPLKFKEIESLFRFGLFTFCWYTFDLIVKILCDSLLWIFNIILCALQLSENETIWSMAVSIFELRIYIRIFFSCSFVFYLSLHMFDTFERPKSFELLNINSYKLIILWFGLYSGLHFIAIFLLSIFLNNLKRSSYKDTIWDLNYKVFIFKKIEKISNAKDPSSKKDICENELPSFDPGFYLKDVDFFLSEEDAGIIANNTLVGLNKSKLLLEDIKEFFPNDYERVYSYLSGGDSVEETPHLTSKAFINRAKELYSKRADMQKTLIDRDYVYDMLESLVSVVTFYVALILLFYLFNFNYKVYFLGFGSTLLTFSWIFADIIKKIFTCFVFVLLIRPYDIGDRVMIQSQNLRVQKVNLLHTTFLNNHKSVIYLANDILFVSPILNYARSPIQSIEIEITPKDIVSFSETKNIEENARSKIQETSKHFTNIELVFKSDSKIRFLVHLKKNLQDEVALNKRKTTLMKIFDKVLDEVAVPHKSSYVFTP